MTNKKTIERKKDFEKLLSIFKESNDFILTTHKGADPDGIGSELGLHFLLNKLGKRSTILNPDKIPDRYSFLDPHQKIRHVEPDKLSIFNSKQTVVIVDNSDISRIGEVSGFLNEDKTNLIIIDHHDGIEESNGLFSFSEIGSTSEIIYELIELAGFEIDYNTAVALYMGIVVDTGQFKYNKTRPRTHEIAGKLLAFNFQTEELIRKIYEDISYQVLYLKRDILATLEISPEFKLATVEITRSMLTKYNFVQNPAEGITGELLSSSDIQIAASFVENESGIIKLSFRSKGKYNVCEVAQQYNGGGHANASGANVKGTLKSVKDEVILKLKDMFKNSN